MDSFPSAWLVLAHRVDTDESWSWPVTPVVTNMVLLHLSHLYGPTKLLASPPSSSTSTNQPKLRPKPPHPLDLDIIEHLRTLADEPVGVWQALNAIAANKAPRNRSESREIKRQLLGRLNTMVRQGLLRRIGRTGLTMPDDPTKPAHDLTGRLGGGVYANFVPVTGAVDACKGGGSAGFVIL